MIDKDPRITRYKAAGIYSRDSLLRPYVHYVPLWKSIIFIFRTCIKYYYTPDILAELLLLMKYVFFSFFFLFMENISMIRVYTRMLTACSCVYHNKIEDKSLRNANHREFETLWNAPKQPEFWMSARMNIYILKGLLLMYASFILCDVLLSDIDQLHRFSMCIQKRG